MSLGIPPLRVRICHFRGFDLSRCFCLGSESPPDELLDPGIPAMRQSLACAWVMWGARHVEVLTNVNGSNGTNMRSGRQLGDAIHNVVIAPNQWADFTQADV